jgi:hypothetical protein
MITRQTRQHPDGPFAAVSQYFWFHARGLLVLHLDNAFAEESVCTLGAGSPEQEIIFLLLISHLYDLPQISLRPDSPLFSRAVTSAPGHAIS